MVQIKITKRSVDAVRATSSDQFLWDTDLKGFGLKVTARGAKSYIVQYRMGGRGLPTRRYTIGAHGAPWTPDKARQRAQELLIVAKSGRDPAEEERLQRAADVDLAFDRYVESFVDGYAKRHQARSWKQARSTLRYNAVPRLGSKPLPKISRREIANLLEDVASRRPATSRYLHATLRKLFRWAVSRGDLGSSPMAEMPAPAPPIKRDRVLADEELHRVWAASHQLDFPFGPMLRVLIATGQRREEVGGMRWSELQFEHCMWSIPADRAKNGLIHDVPLNNLAVAELEMLRDELPDFETDSIQNAESVAQSRVNDLIFSTTGTSPPSGWGKAKARLDAVLANERDQPIQHWRIHDLRRTFATGLQRLGIRYEVTEALLNHVSGSRAGVAGIYQRHNWSAEKRTALDAWNTALVQLIENPKLGLTGRAVGKISQLRLENTSEAA